MKHISEPTSLAQALVACGVKKTNARVIDILSDHLPHEMHEIEKKTDLRQPEVSTSVTALTPYLTFKSKPVTTKGRPHKIIVLSKDGLKEYIESIVSKNNNEVLETTKAIEALEGFGV